MNTTGHDPCKNRLGNGDVKPKTIALESRTDPSMSPSFRAPLEDGILLVPLDDRLAGPILDRPTIDCSSKTSRT
ncbi:hypothetical protein CC2G_007050 [Coprinopsis cinerea AmutBmut pab1-1]|nr:hypothetical protein CC2G_007050 [Coprinopsis cinerea AmutBmut pab1-1]